MEHMSIRHRIREAIITLFSIAGVCALYRAFLRKRGPLVRVVVFHDIEDSVWFNEALDTIKASTHILTPEEFHAGIYDEKRINTLITFDDGYASWVEVALPVLKAHEIKGLFFINSGLLTSAENQTSESFMKEKLLIRPRAPLTWEGARTLTREGHTIGGHARSHENLALLSPEALHDEIVHDKQKIETELEVTLTDFAYPFGTRAHVSEAVGKAVREAGYTRAYTAISRFHIDKDGTFFIPRMCIETGHEGKGLSRWLNGGYDLFDILKSCVA